MSAIPLDKRTLRKRLLEARRAIPPEVRAEIADGIFRNVIALDAYRQARTVFLYCATDEEISTVRLMEDALQSGKRVCVPLCTDVYGVMEARELPALSRLLPGHFGIPEPPPDASFVPPREIDLCIVPCLSADAAGYRLGYGGGYYDRFLAECTAQTAALCMEQFFADVLPTEPNDHPCGMIVTERRVHIAT